MKYKHAFTFLFSRPNWTKELLLMAVCILIPVVGILVLLGYRSELLDDWLDGKDDQQVRGFDFNRFSPQLMRGIWPFLYQLIIGMAVGMVFAVMYVVAVLIVFASKSPELFVIFYILYMIAVFVLQVFMQAVIWPFSTYGSITAKFDLKAAWAFAKDYYQRLGFFFLVVTALNYMLLSMLSSFAGLAMCCVGVYPAAAVISMADGNLVYQLYQRYLERGGEPLPRFVPDEPKPHSSDSHSEPEAT